MIIVVGERANQEGSFTLNFTADLEARLKEGAFTDGVSRNSLTKMGFTRLERSFNLLAPMPTRHSSWLAEDKAAARKVADAAIEKFYVDNPTFILFGGRVQWAFHAKMANFVELTRAHRGMKYTLLSMPHPSPRNRLWNSEETWRQAREAVLKVQERHARRGEP